MGPRRSSFDPETWIDPAAPTWARGSRISQMTTINVSVGVREGEVSSPSPTNDLDQRNRKSTAWGVGGYGREDRSRVSDLSRLSVRHEEVRLRRSLSGCVGELCCVGLELVLSVCVCGRSGCYW